MENKEAYPIKRNKVTNHNSGVENNISQESMAWKLLPNTIKMEMKRTSIF